MVKKRSIKESASSIPGGIGVGLIISVLTMVLGSVISAYLIHKEIIMQESMGIAVYAVLAVSSAAGALAAVYRVKRMRLQLCLLTGGSYFLLLLSMTALFLGGQYEGVLSAGLTILVGSGVVAILNVLPVKRGKPFKRKSVYR